MVGVQSSGVRRVEGEGRVRGGGVRHLAQDDGLAIAGDGQNDGVPLVDAHLGLRVVQTGPVTAMPLTNSGCASLNVSVAVIVVDGCR